MNSPLCSPTANPLTMRHSPIRMPHPMLAMMCPSGCRSRIKRLHGKVDFFVEQASSLARFSAQCTSEDACATTNSLSSQSLDFLHQLFDNLDNLFRRLYTKIAGTGAPGLVTAESMMLRRREVSVVSVGQRDDARDRKRTTLLDL